MFKLQVLGDLVGADVMGTVGDVVGVEVGDVVGEAVGGLVAPHVPKVVDSDEPNSPPCFIKVPSKLSL